MSFFNMTWLCGYEKSLCCDNHSNATIVDDRVAELIRRNRLIEEQIARDRNYAKDTMKILLLGRLEYLF